MKKLIRNNDCVIIGPIRQEILSGIASEQIFKELAKFLKEIPDLEITSDIYLKAAECFNLCRKKGIQGSHIDFLICAVSIHYQLPIFTLDKDFEQYKKHIPIYI